MNQSKHLNNVIKQNAIFIPPLLPSAYQQVEYIHAKGNQYINTGVKTANNIGIRAKVSADSGVGNPVLCGAIGSGSNRYYFWVFGSGATVWYGYRGTYGNTGKAWVTGTVYEIESYIGTSQITMEQKGTNGWTYNAGISGSYSGNLDLYLLAMNNNGTGRSSLLTGNLYSFSMYDNNGNIRDMYPCYRKSDNKPGMYDLVTDTFFTNVGGGDFTVGPDV